MTRAGKILLTLLFACGVLVMLFFLRSWQRERHAAALAQMPLRERGLALLEDLDCVSCHQASSSYRAPVLDGLLGRIRNLADGTSIQIDEVYLRESILNPNAKIAAGYQPIMPSYEGKLAADELNAIVEALK